MKTPLYDKHKELKARIVDFHGWMMPIQYTSIIEEHNNVRKNAGIFDLSHMGRVEIEGKDRNSYLQKLLTVDIEKIENGRAKYCFFLNENGGVLDDLIVYQDDKKAFLVINASNRIKILKWMENHRNNFEISITDKTQKTALIAIQGPHSEKVMRDVFDLNLSRIKYYRFTTAKIEGLDTMVARTGYTGEDGFEIFIDAQKAANVWDRLSKAGVNPTGLGARDTLRTEAGMALYGQEIDEEINPLEAGLLFAISLEKPDYIGKKALEKIKGSGISRKLAGFSSSKKRIPRNGMEIYDSNGENTIGYVTSGTFSPTLSKPIAMGYVGADFAGIGKKVLINMRGEKEEFEIIKLPFYSRKA
ncbi:glycine cleavage system aminomethyltransferase GcvT [Candidatus Peregrinibacteria bacterium]|nr:glycine cleavage system aminomethyltransferase GcvT [Candidatus Peregrinibacteria bacterium]